MPLWVRPNLVFLNLGEAGDTGLVESLGVDLLLVLGARLAHHSERVGTFTLHFKRGAEVEVCQRIVQALKGWYDASKKVAIADDAGGWRLGAWLWACVRAALAAKSFGSQMADIETEFTASKPAVPEALKAQARAVWP